MLVRNFSDGRPALTPHAPFIHYTQFNRKQKSEKYPRLPALKQKPLPKTILKLQVSFLLERGCFTQECVTKPHNHHPDRSCQGSAVTPRVVPSWFYTRSVADQAWRDNSGGTRDWWGTIRCSRSCCATSGGRRRPTDGDECRDTRGSVVHRD